MCFYKDTQALLAKNSLRQFFLQKISHNAEKPKDISFQVKQEENFKESPHKKLHISKDLFKDLLKLSGSENDLGNGSETSTTQDQVTPALEQFPTAEKIGLKYEFNAEQALVPEKVDPINHINDLLTMIEKNNQILESYVAAQDTMEKQIKVLAKQAREHDIDESPFERLNRMSRQEKEAVRATTTPSYFEMLSVFTKGRTHFPYALRLSVGLPSPILREKNIKISVQLVKTSDGSVVEDHGNMLLQISLHTWELPSHPIVRNKAGNKVLQGEDECELKNGQGSFDKLQIDEVTSKFINGYIGIMIVAKRPCNFGTSLESLQQKRLFKIQDIQPLLVEKVIVKSKKKNVVKA